MNKLFRFHYGFIIAGFSLILLIITSGMILSIGIFVKPISQEFLWDRSVFSSIIAGFMIVQGLFSPFLGNLITKVGPKKVISIGVLLQGLVYISLSFLQNLTQFFLLYTLIMAVAYGTTALVTISVLISIWFEKRKGLIMGITMAGLPLGPQLLTPVITYWLIQLGWRNTFLILGMILLGILLPLGLVFLKNKPQDMGLLPYGKEEGCETEESKGLSHHEGKPVSYLAVFRNKEYYKLSFSYFACGYTLSFFSTHFFSYGTDIGLDPLVAAFAFGLTGSAAAIGTPLAGGLSDRWGGKTMLSIVYLLRAISFIMIGLASDNWYIYLGAVIYGLSWTATGPLTSMLAGEIWGTFSLGKVFGSIFLVHQIGAALGAWLGGVIYDYTGSYFFGFILSAIVLIMGAVLSLSVKAQKGIKPHLAITPSAGTADLS
ncbi:MFS transporter [Microaerobacter geothermalis]|uniref:MFS transporter n=1 Tax=Microaerobacter geothermalis TaxID=674972 RepID=UPI001F2470F5|nr:MFS transporter [Microaerobacter geothermalis]MCF6093041.1 MFS transporter [Microaerobacter geothermalis]